MEIRRGNSKDLSSVHDVTKLCTRFLLENQIYQWNEGYPSLEVLKLDIERKQLWLLESNEEIIGMIVLSDIMDEEYKDVQWIAESGKNLYIHRLAIHPSHQGKGCAQLLMDFAEKCAAENKYTSIRLDTFSENKRNQIFYNLRNYQKIDTIYLPEQSDSPFYCYEKLVNE